MHTLNGTLFYDTHTPSGTHFLDNSVYRPRGLENDICISTQFMAITFKLLEIVHIWYTYSANRFLYINNSVSRLMTWNLTFIFLILGHNF